MFDVRQLDELDMFHVLLHLCLLPPEAQLTHFYLSHLRPVDTADHEAEVTLDDDFSYAISNPVYQLFCALVLEDYCIMNLADALEIEPRLHELLERHRFPDSLKADFVRELAWNTSREGFVAGQHWQRIRARCAHLLRLLDLGPPPRLPKPIKFRPFLYPDDVAEYQPYPGWARHGQLMPREQWQFWREHTARAYAKDPLRNPVPGFGTD